MFISSREFAARRKQNAQYLATFVPWCCSCLSTPDDLQSSTYRTIIDDVIANVRQDFEDMGIEKEVLEELQRVSSILAAL